MLRVPLALFITLSACTDPGIDNDAGSSDADYATLFDNGFVHRLDIVIDGDDYAAMQTDVASLFSGGGGPGGSPDPSEDPMYVAADISFDGVTLEHVGMRYKGNSSLRTLTQQGNRKKPFRLNMDKMADDYPDTDGQELLGFEELTFSPNYLDDSQVREAFAAELFSDFGVPAARWAFTEVYVDTGDGPEYWGLYTMLEDPSDNPFRQRVFQDDDGNMYKPESTWQRFSEDEFEKKTNEGAADWSDVEAAISALHASTSDAQAWRSDLEAVFDVDAFLSWLALNTVMVNWDSYGEMAHNYYIYGDPLDDGRLVWIPWDHNEAMLERGGGGPGGPGGGSETPQAEVFHTNVGSAWPLISVLLADDVYMDVYTAEVERALTGSFAETTAADRLQELHDLVADSVSREESGSTTVSSQAAFERSVDELTDHIAERHMVVEEALGEQ